MRNLGFLLALAACGSNGTGNDVTCGDGTMLVDNMCQPTAGSGSDTTCGTGTHLDGTMCVPDGSGAAGAPTITMMDPNDAGISGLTLFTITGTNFAGADVSDLHVYFGDLTSDCEAQVGAATPTTIAGEVPVACDLTVLVTVSTNKGMAAIPFQYDALFAADGDGGGAFGTESYGDLYVIDPFSHLYLDAGVINDGQTPYGLSGIAFDPTGVLYGVTTGDSPADNDDGASQLVTITLDPMNGPVVTVIGETVDAEHEPYLITDIKMSGTTLYGWAYSFDEEVDQGLVTIDTTHGTVQPAPTGTVASLDWEVGGLAIDGNNTIYVAPNGAAPDATVGATGELATVNSASGALTNATLLDWPGGNADAGAPIEAMAYLGTALVAVVDNGTYGVQTQQPIYGETLALIDPAQNPIVSPLFELPAQTGAQSIVDAIDVPPAGASYPKLLRHKNWQHLNAASTMPARARSRGARAPHKRLAAKR